MLDSDLDHTNDTLRQSLKDWMSWLRSEIGFDSFRFDFVKVRRPDPRSQSPLRL